MRFLLLFAIIFIFLPSFADSTKKIIKIAVIDTGFSRTKLSNVRICGEKDFSGTGSVDTHGHGTHITNLIDITANSDRSRYCFIIVKAYNMRIGKQYVPEAFEYLLKIKPNIINISGGGYGKINSEQKAIIKLLDKGVVIVAASGNEGNNLDNDCNYFPACYDSRIIVVGNIAKSSNYGKNVVDITLNGNNINVLGKVMTGSSQSTAIFTGILTSNFVKDIMRRK